MLACCLCTVCRPQKTDCLPKCECCPTQLNTWVLTYAFWLPLDTYTARKMTGAASAAWAPTLCAHLVGPKAKGHAPGSQQVHAAVHCDVCIPSSSFNRCAGQSRAGLRWQTCTLDVHLCDAHANHRTCIKSQIDGIGHMQTSLCFEAMRVGLLFCRPPTVPQPPTATWFASKQMQKCAV